MNLRQAVEMAKRILKKEKIDRQLAGQTSSTPFMSVGDGLNKRVTFNLTDDIECKIDKLMVMMGKLVTEDKGQNKPFKLQVYQSNRGRGQTTHNYDQRRYEGRFSQTVCTEDIQDIIKLLGVGQDMIPIEEVVTGTIKEVVRDLVGIVIMIMEEVVIEI